MNDLEVNLIEGKYIWRLSEKGELYLEIFLSDPEVYREALRETEDGYRYYELLRYKKYYDEFGKEMEDWERRYSIQYYDEAGNKVELLLEPSDDEEEDDFNWMHHYGRIDYIEIEGLPDIRLEAVRGFSGR